MGRIDFFYRIVHLFGVKVKLYNISTKEVFLLSGVHLTIDKMVKRDSGLTKDSLLLYSSSKTVEEYSV